jgi:retron-type reverse transcriptase
MADQPEQPQPRTRQEIYDRIRETSKEEFILEDMLRLGFWPPPGLADAKPPEDPAAELRRRKELQRELETLRQTERRLYNEEAMLKELRRRRLLESREKRKETKLRRERERKERAAAWQQRKAGEILFLGEGVSGGLSEREGDEARLRRLGLPVFSTPEGLAAAMGISVGALRFLSFSRRTAPITHYVRFTIPKKTGGTRLISAPRARLKRAQEWVLSNILSKVAVHEAAHGFAKDRSILTNARPHVGQAVVLNLDLKDFFPTLHYRRVKGLFRALGYSESVATVLGLLCTEPDSTEVELDGRRFHVALGERHLPQGAPTSPAITNLVCRRLDRRLTALAARLGFVYTRYADDLTFSAPAQPPPVPGEAATASGRVGRLRRGVFGIIAHEGFVVHPDKTRVLRRGRRQEVTGLVVNDRPGVPRDVLRRFRATLYQIEKDGPQGKKWGRSPDVLAAVVGFASYVHMVDPEKGAGLLTRARAAAEKQPAEAPPPAAAPAATPAPEPAAAPAEQKPKKKWWKLW